MIFGLELIIIRGMLSWSLIPGMVVDRSTSVGLVVKNKSKVLFFLVGFVTICSRPKSAAILSICLEMAGYDPPGVKRLVSQFMSGILKSPPSQI